MNIEKQNKLVVLIDADNASPANIDGLMEEIAKYGIAIVKRIYGDWTSPNLKGWKEMLPLHAIQPMQQFGYTTGKNSTDSAMIIDAMDILYTSKADGFCIVSSDSDFTRLASRIREAGLIVYGFGERKTPEAFIKACNKFIYVENLKCDDEEIEAKPKKYSSNELKADTTLVNLLRAAVNASEDDDGWAYLATVGQYINNKASEFDPRSYGYTKLHELIKAIKLFDIDPRKDPRAPNIKQIYIKDNRKKRSNGDEPHIIKEESNEV